MIKLFTKSQRQAFIHSLGLSEQLLDDARRTQAIISSAAEKLRQDIDKTELPKFQKAEKYAEILFQLAADRLYLIEKEIRLSVENVVGNAKISISRADANDDRSHNYHYQVVETAKQLGYSANFRRNHNWIQIEINVGRPTMILLSFHGVGHDYIGLLACSACAYHLDYKGEDTAVNEILALTESPFTFSYADRQENLVLRFKEWLEGALVAGLEYWNKSL